MDKGDNPVCARSTTHPANIDNVAFHLAIMVALYGVAYAFGVWWLCSMPKGISWYWHDLRAGNVPDHDLPQDHGKNRYYPSH